MNLIVNQPQQRSVLSMKRIQLLVGLSLATIVPLLNGVASAPEFFTSTTTTNSIIGIFFCVIVGYWMSVRLHAFPGVSSGAYTVLCFSAAYGALACIFFLFRMNYSIIVLLTSYATATLWFLYVKLRVDGVARLRMALVDTGDTKRLLRIPNIEWIAISNPKEFAADMGCVVADLRTNFDDEWLKFLSETALQGTPVYHVKHIEEELSGQMEMEHLSENNFGSLLPNMVYLQIKLVLDVLLALVLIIPVFVVLLILAPVCLFVQGRPFFFVQERMGYRGRPFNVYKIRTMIAGSQQLTRLGGLLRRTRIDELPQIINILKGEMSWIGPRPETMRLSNWYESELAFYRYRHIVRPGLSGWAQVRQGHVVELDDATTKLKLDFFYIKNISPWLDFLIAFRTLKILATGFGSR